MSWESLRSGYRRVGFRLEAERTGDCGARHGGELLAVARAVERRQDANVHLQRSLAAEQAKHIVLSGFVEPTDFRSGGPVIDRDGSDGDVLRREIGRFEQGRSKRQKVG